MLTDAHAHTWRKQVRAAAEAKAHDEAVNAARVRAKEEWEERVAESKKAAEELESAPLVDFKARLEALGKVGVVVVVVAFEVVVLAAVLGLVVVVVAAVVAGECSSG